MTIKLDLLSTALGMFAGVLLTAAVALIAWDSTLGVHSPSGLR